MASPKTLALLFLVFAATGALAATFEVGDDKTWAIPSSPSFYSDWAARQTFAVGDTLVFNFATGAHNVLEVTKAAYDSCSTSSPIAVFTAGPASVELTSGGDKYFICGVGGHCSAGQKMALTVTESSTPSAPPPESSIPSAPPPESSTPSAPPPAPSSAGRPAAAPAPSNLGPSPSAAPTPVPGAAPSPALGTAAFASAAGLLAAAAALVL